MNTAPGNCSVAFLGIGASSDGTKVFKIAVHWVGVYLVLVLGNLRIREVAFFQVT